MSGVFTVYVRNPGERDISTYRTFPHDDQYGDKERAESEAHSCLVDWLDEHYPDQWHLSLSGDRIPSADLRIMLKYRQVPRGGQYLDVDGLPGSVVPGRVTHHAPTLEERVAALERRVSQLEAAK